MQQLTCIIGLCCSFNSLLLSFVLAALRHYFSRKKKNCMSETLWKILKHFGRLVATRLTFFRAPRKKDFLVSRVATPPDPYTQPLGVAQLLLKRVVPRSQKEGAGKRKEKRKPQKRWVVNSPLWKSEFLKPF